MGAASDQTHGVPGSRKPRSDESPDGPGADHANLHGRGLGGSASRMKSRTTPI